LSIISIDIQNIHAYTQVVEGQLIFGMISYFLGLVWPELVMVIGLICGLPFLLAFTVGLISMVSADPATSQQIAGNLTSLVTLQFSNEFVASVGRYAAFIFWGSLLGALTRLLSGNN
jgi:hypothetical protein